MRLGSWDGNATGSVDHRVSHTGFAATLAFLLAILAVTSIDEANANPDTIDIVVRDAACLAAEPPDLSTCDIEHFKWMVNLDNSHEDPSLTAPASYSPVIATGDETNAAGVDLPVTGPADRGYLVSVLANDGVGPLNDPEYKIGGTHFALPLPADADDVVIVELQPNPLPLATVRVKVFHDNQLTNSEDDIPLEEGLGGFHVTLADRVGEVTTDWFGNPICTEYEDLNGNGVFDFPGDDGVDGPVPVPGTGGFCVSDGDGIDVDGDGYSDGVDSNNDGVVDGPDPDGIPKGYAVVPNMGPDKYEVQVIPPDGQGWIQTTTIEGTLAEDAWVEEGHSGFSTEEGFTQAVVWFGFVRECTFGDDADDCPTNDDAGTGSISGTVKSIALDDESGIILLGKPVVRPYVALNDIGGNDEQVYTGRGNVDGSFTIPAVPEGLYQLVMWDGPLDHIISFRTVQVSAGEDVEVRDCTDLECGIGIPRWFGTIRGYAYIDNGVAADGHDLPDGSDENGIRDCYDDGDDFDGDGDSSEIEYNDLNSCERGLTGQDLDTRYKDGTIQYATFANNNGYYEFPEVFELEHFAIAEVGYKNMKQTGATGYNTDRFGNPIGYPDGDYPDNFVNQDLGLASLLQAEATWGGTTNYIDWGKKALDTSGCGTPDPADPCENGGIVGIVFNATTRNELDARLQANEDYEPGVPGVVVNLYSAKLDGNGDIVHDTDGSVAKDHIVASYGGADSWYDSLPTDCIPKSSVGRLPGEIEPDNLFPDCIELPALQNQIKSGVFDGGYAFDVDCSNLGVPGNLDPGLLSEDCSPLGQGQYIVEIEPPAGYRSVMEEDINVFGGDQFVPAVPPFPCAGPMHTVDVVDVPGDANFDPTHPSETHGVYNPDFLATTSALAPNGGSPYQDQEKPLCDARIVDLQKGGFVNSDFFVFTDAVDMDPTTVEGPDEIPTGAGIPMPGRIRGVLLDDLTVELDPTSPMYGEKRGIPNAPIGIRDFTGKLITTVYSDENGYWEVTLPSTGTYNCALPAGPCPGMYQVVGNDPGTPENPNEGWDPNYGALKLSFDVWPALTTYADVAILPITGFVQDPGSQFESPPQCEITAGAPDLQEVSDVLRTAGQTLTITGSGFNGATATLDGTAITTVVNSDTSITATIPAGTAPGPHELLLREGGVNSPLGITIHVTGTGYSFSATQQRHVGAGEEYTTVQSALDAAVDGDIVIVHPGVYYESLLVDERIKLQGFGPGATVIDGRFFNFGGVSAGQFAAKIAATAYDGPAVVPMGQVITVLAEKGEFTSGVNAQIDGFKLSGGNRVRGSRTAPSQGGAIYGHAYARNLQVSNNLIQSNAGNLGGGVSFGRPGTPNPDEPGSAEDMQNDDIRIDHNRILNNGGVSLAGAVGLFNGTQSFEIDHNEICGNYSAEYGGGISNYGYSSGSIHDNRILFNYAFDEGGGIMLGGQQPANVALVSPGTGDIDVERNLIQGNASNDDGGGVRLLQPVDGRIRIVNNMIVNNIATDGGGGIALDDALQVEIINNTVARNVSTSTAEDAPIDLDPEPPPASGPGRVTLPQGAGLVSELHSQALMDAEDPSTDFSDPVLFNNIFWENEACSLDGNLDLFGTDGCEVPGLPSAGFRDFEVLDGLAAGDPGHRTFSATYSVCTDFTGDCPNDGTNKDTDPAFAAAIPTTFKALAFGGDPTFVTVILTASPSDPPGDYHVGASLPTLNAGAASVGGFSAPCDDVDGDGRPNGSAWDIGADEQPDGTSKCLFFSTEGNTAVPGITDPDNADIYLWNGAAFGRVFDATDAGLGGGANIDALVAVDSDTFYMSFTGNLNLPGVGTVQNRDVVRYTGGAWTLFFDGDDVGLTMAAENVDAFEVLGAGSVAVSTDGNPDVPGISGENDEDLLRCTGSFGPTTSCTWSYYLDGSDVGLDSTANEDLDGAAVLGGDLYLSTLGAFTTADPPGPPTSLSGGGEDVFSCNAFVPGTTSSCGSFSMFFDGSMQGVTPGNLDAIDRP